MENNNRIKKVISRKTEDNISGRKVEHFYVGYEYEKDITLLQICQQG